MESPPQVEPPPIEPTFTPEELDERKCQDYFLDEIGRLHGRGLIPDDSLATIRAETHARREGTERRARGRTALNLARQSAAADPRSALVWAERARSIEPDQPEAWALAVGLHRRLHEPDRAIALCEEAAGRFADFPIRPERLRAEVAAQPAVDLTALAREALQRGDDREVVELCTRRLNEQPDHLDSVVLRAFALQRLGRLEEASADYRHASELDPQNPVWTRWVANVEGRLNRQAPSAGKATPTPPQPRPAVQAKPEPEPELVLIPAEPRLSWSAVSREFLQDHWQIILSGMAVLLIVVSSNLGAAQVLGPRLWSPAGKTVLALVYTSMFAAFGIGLTRWGAARAGRVMLLTTLIVVPANFMLAGTMRLVTAPTGPGLALMLVDAASLLLLIRAVTWSLGAKGREAWGLTAGIFALSAFNAVAAPGLSWPFAWQFGLFLAPGAVFLAAVTWLNTRFEARGFEDRGVATYAAIGLFAFAFLTCVGRTGAFVLELPPALYAIPVMVAGLGIVQTSGSLKRFDPNPMRATWGRYAGVVLSFLAFALALARPPVVSPVFSGNTLAVSLMGLGLYAYLLRRERLPAYLYFAFGALIAAYFGSFYFVKDLVHSVEEVAREALGYQQPLPQPFKAINGLVFSPLLAGLSLYFRRRWNDPVLARHCHLIGVPFSIGCCVVSAFEPKAAVICLSGYAVLYALAARVFAQPKVIYLATSALAGAAYFGMSLVPNAGLAEQALVAALIGLGEWAIERVCRARGAEVAYRRPLGQAALAMSGLAMLAGVGSAFQTAGATGTAALAFAVVALTAVLLNREESGTVLAYVAAVSGSLAYGFFILSTGHRFGAGLNKAEDAAAAGASAFILATLATRLAHFARRDDGTPTRFAVYPSPMANVGLIHVVLAVAFAAAHLFDLGPMVPTRDDLTLAGASALAAGALAMLSLRDPSRTLVHLSLLLGLGAWVALGRAALGTHIQGPADYGALGTGYAFALAVWGEAVRRWILERKSLPADPELATSPTPRLARFSNSVPAFLVTLTVLASGLTTFAWVADVSTPATFGLGSAAVLLATRQRRAALLVDLGMFLAVVSALTTAVWHFSGAGRSNDLLGLLSLTAAGTAFAIRALGVWAERTNGGELWARGCQRAAAATCTLLIVPAVIASFFSQAVYPHAAAALGLGALTFLWLTVSLARPDLTYQALASLVAAVYVVLFNQGTGRRETLFIPAFVAVAIAYLFQAVGFLGRARAGGGERTERVYLRPLFRSALLMAVLGFVAAVPVTRINEAFPGAIATMLLAGASFLGLVKAWPARSWLYATIAAWCATLYFGALIDGPSDRVVTAAMVVAYQLWLLGLLARRFEPLLVRLFALPQSGYDGPIFKSALVSASVAALLRLGDTLYGDLAWHDSAGLTLNLAVFALVMVKAYPSRVWVHLSVVLASLSAAMAVEPRVSTETWHLTLLLALAHLWLVLGWLWARYNEPIGRLLRLEPRGYPGVLHGWSRLDFVLGAAMVAAVVALESNWGVFGVVLFIRHGSEGWWAVLCALALTGAYVAAGWGRKQPCDAVLGGCLTTVGTVWWLCVAGSPLPARLGLSSAECLPPATSFMALATVLGAAVLVRPSTWRGAYDRPDDAFPGARLRLDVAMLFLAQTLAVIGATATLGRPGIGYVATLALSTLALGAAAVARGKVPAAYLAGLIGSWAGLAGALEGLRRFEVTSGPDRVVASAVGLLLAVLALWVVSGILRRRQGRDFVESESTSTTNRPVPVAFEEVALLSSIFCASGIVSTLFLDARPTDRAALMAVGVLFGLALVSVGLLRRWRVAWLVYAAQSALLGSYLYYRWAFPLPATTDAVVLVLFGYLDFGLAEAMRRAGFSTYARPTRRFALLVPLLPLGLSLWNRSLDENGLFILFTAATFYGVACYRLQSRSVGYAAAVLYNGFLWLLWSRVGWTLSDRPQFFLAPVGLTAILFAEMNRSTFPKPLVNAVRGIGLSTIYLSLAVPVWQFQSLGAWAALLAASIAGVFVGIGLRVQTFLWLGLTGFFLDVVYQLGRFGMENTLAKWAIMLGLGILIMLFVALNEKKRIVETMRNMFHEARQWE